MKRFIGNIFLQYIRVMARLQLKKNKQAIVIGITGSAGKTSTRLAVATILKHKGKVKHSIHANSESGIPLNILGLQANDYSILDWVRLCVLAPIKLMTNWEHFDYYVVEMGIDSPRPPKNMDYLLRIIVPEVAIVLGAGLVHSAEFDGLVTDKSPARRPAKIMQAIASEKMKLAYAVPPSGVAIINNDQKELTDLIKNIKGRLITVGSSSRSTIHINKVTSAKEFACDFTYQNQLYRLSVPQILEHNYAYTFLTAIAAGIAVGIFPKESIQYLREYAPARGRMTLFSGVKETHIIDSSYNSSPSTAESALKLLKKMGTRSHTVAILGDMRELGAQTKLAHKNLAEMVLKNCDECILFGKSTKEYTLPVLESAHFPVHHFAQIRELNKYLDKNLKRGSWILVKGSQNTILLERVVEHILANPSDVKRLARRGSYWDKVRSQTP